MIERPHGVAPEGLHELQPSQVRTLCLLDWQVQPLIGAVMSMQWFQPAAIDSHRQLLHAPRRLDFHKYRPQFHGDTSMIGFRVKASLHSVLRMLLRAN